MIFSDTMALLLSFFLWRNLLNLLPSLYFCMAGDSLDKLMYSFVLDDVLKDFYFRTAWLCACVYDLGRGTQKSLTPGLHLKIPFGKSQIV